MDIDAIRMVLMHIAKNYPEHPSRAEKSHILAFITVLLLYVQHASNIEHLKTAVDGRSQLREWVAGFGLLSSSDDEFLSEWGPHYWALINVIVDRFPRRPRAADIVNTQSFFRHLGYAFPCEECRDNYNTFIDASPVATQSQDSLRRWIENIMLNDWNSKGSCVSSTLIPRGRIMTLSLKCSAAINFEMMKHPYILNDPDPVGRALEYANSRAARKDFTN